jgi:hypothetical protein
MILARGRCGLNRGWGDGCGGGCGDGSGDLLGFHGSCSHEDVHRRVWLLAPSKYDFWGLAGV